MKTCATPGYRVKVSDIEVFIINARAFIDRKRDEYFEEAIANKMRGIFGFFKKTREKAIESVRNDTSDWCPNYLYAYSSLERFCDKIEEALIVHNDDYVYMDLNDAKTISEYLKMTEEEK